MYQSDIFHKISVELLKNDHFLILTHKNPDGDCIGAGYALCIALRAMRKKANVKVVDGPLVFDYIYQYIEPEDFEPQTIISVDVPTRRLLCEDRPVDICIDHHKDNDISARLSYVNPKASACCEIVYKLIESWDLLMMANDKMISNCLYTGIATDTGCFKFSNVTSDTFLIAANLLLCGAEHSVINKKVFDTKTREQIAYKKDVESTLEYHCEGQMALVVVRKELNEQYPNGMSKDITQITRTIEGVKLGITIYEDSEKFCRVSIRGNYGTSARDFALIFHGGGHEAASGCAFQLPLEKVKEKLISAAESFLNINKLIHHVSERLGDFYYNPDEFYVDKYGHLRYIGNETDGKKITIPEGIRNCCSMFYGCTNLKTAPTIPEGVESCNCMFADCTSLETAPAIPEGVKNCSWMFESCTSLEIAPTIPECVEDYRGMFLGCASLETAPAISEGVKDCSFMFYGCTSLETAPAIPEGVKNCSWMFSGCTNLEAAPAIPDSVEDCRFMFQGCTSLETAPTIPDSVKVCGFMFEGCTSLKTAPTIPEGVMDCRCMFDGCTNLKK